MLVQRLSIVIDFFDSKQTMTMLILTWTHNHLASINCQGRSSNKRGFITR